MPQRSLDGELLYTCTTVLWTDDTQHEAEPLPKNGFVVIFDPNEIFDTGRSFDRHQVAITLHENNWPLGIVFKDLSDGNWYRVVENKKVKMRQKLRCIFDTCELEPRCNSGGFKRNEPETGS